MISQQQLAQALGVSESRISRLTKLYERRHMRKLERSGRSKLIPPDVEQIIRRAIELIDSQKESKIQVTFESALQAAQAAIAHEGQPMKVTEVQAALQRFDEALQLADNYMENCPPHLSESLWQTGQVRLRQLQSTARDLLMQTSTETAPPVVGDPSTLISQLAQLLTDFSRVMTVVVPLAPAIAACSSAWNDSRVSAPELGVFIERWRREVSPLATVLEEQVRLHATAEQVIDKVGEPEFDETEEEEVSVGEEVDAGNGITDDEESVHLEGDSPPVAASHGQTNRFEEDPGLPF